MKASTIDWGTGAQDISSDTDVSTTGTLVYAYNVGASGVAATTVNGVTFQPFVFPAFNQGINTTTQGNITFTENNGTLAGTNSTGSSFGSFSNLSAAYQALLSSGGLSGNFATLTLTMSGLTLGQNYQFEWWTNSSNLSIPGSTTASAGNSVTLNSNTTDALGGVGQYALGSFTADSSSQSIGFVGTSNFPLVNGFELRTEDVPEPSTWAMLFGGLSLLAFWRARRAA